MDEAIIQPHRLFQEREAKVLTKGCQVGVVGRDQGRQKDLDDCAILLLKTKIRTRKQAQQVLDRSILPNGQQKNAESIENALNQLFGREA